MLKSFTLQRTGHTEVTKWRFITCMPENKEIQEISSLWRTGRPAVTFKMQWKLRRTKRQCWRPRHLIISWEASSLFLPILVTPPYLPVSSLVSFSLNNSCLHLQFLLLMSSLEIKCPKKEDQNIFFSNPLRQNILTGLRVLSPCHLLGC